MAITFPPGEQSVIKRKCVAFLAELNGVRLMCRIAFDALMEFPEGNRRHHLTTFRANRPAIEARAATLIESGRLLNSELTLLPADILECM